MPLMCMCMCMCWCWRAGVLVHVLVLVLVLHVPLMYHHEIVAQAMYNDDMISTRHRRVFLNHSCQRNLAGISPGLRWALFWGPGECPFRRCCDLLS